MASIPKTAPQQAYLGAESLAAVLEAHRAAAPARAEPCGLLLGTFDGARARIADVRVLPNVHPTPDRAFLLPAQGAVAAAREAREKGLHIVGVWHGHLHGPARLSESDAAGLMSASRVAGSEGRSVEVPYVFVVSGAGAGKAVVVRAFAMHRGRPREIALALGRRAGAA